MHQDRGLNGLSRVFVAKVMLGEAPKLVIDDWRQLLGGAGVTVFPFQQQARYLGPGIHSAPFFYVSDGQPAKAKSRLREATISKKNREEASASPARKRGATNLAWSEAPFQVIPM